MTEDEARDWISARYGSIATERVAAFLAMVAAENERQNLVAPSTIATIWTRHAVDSAQLVPLASEGSWIDIGSGGGFPGIVVAILRDAPMLLVEPRRKRAAFLQACIDTLGLSATTVVTAKVEAVAATAMNISARAVGSIENLLHAAAHCGTVDTRWILPRGRFDAVEMTVVLRRWRCVFHVEQSLTAPDSSIVIVEQVNKR